MVPRARLAVGPAALRAPRIATTGGDTPERRGLLPMPLTLAGGSMHDPAPHTPTNSLLLIPRRLRSRQTRPPSKTFDVIIHMYKLLFINMN
ncbi:hypothetical protein DN412_27770 [Cupriavidus lacunae]|uniref:Uncharacterized protein n=1 Tax=Cupriavidus lacunae TaxID=2666307 RepID=A0A370NNR8_9BURK|nr:hypothetical protein DN412_27770 [Cupriavidus lacunae]